MKKDSKGGKNLWHKGSGKNGSKGQEKGGKWENRTICTRGKTGQMAEWCPKVGNKHQYAIDEEESETLKNCLTKMKSCKCGACWKKVKMSSGKR